jgi:WD40 repeat protein
MGLQLTGLESQASIDSQASISSFLSSGSSDCSTLNRGPHKCLAILHGQSLHVTTLALSGDVLYAGSNHGEIRAWEHPDMLEQARFGCGGAAVKCLVVVDGDKLISAHQDHKIRVWRRSISQPQEHRLVTSLPSVKDYIANFLPAKNYVQVRRHHKALWINHHDSISTLAVGNGVIYSGSWDKSVKVWRLSDFKCLESLNEHIDAVNALAVDKQNDILYSGSGDTTIKAFQRTETAGKSKTKKHHKVIATLEAKSPVNALALSPDMSILYSGQSDKSVTVWKVSDDGDEVVPGKRWTTVGALRGHRLSVLCVVTMANLVISGSADKSVRVWRRACGPDGLLQHSCVSVMVGHNGPVKALCVLENMAMGALVYSGAMDGDVRVWWIPDDDSDPDVDSGAATPDSPLLVNWRLSESPSL